MELSLSKDEALGLPRWPDVSQSNDDRPASSESLVRFIGACIGSETNNVDFTYFASVSRIYRSITITGFNKVKPRGHTPRHLTGEVI